MITIDCRSPLSIRELPPNTPDLWVRIYTLDPCQIYDRLGARINPYKRHHTARDFYSNDIFPPQNNGVCDCGCNRPITGKRRRWATDDCGKLVWSITSILHGDSAFIRKLLAHYYFGSRSIEACMKCGLADIPAFVPASGNTSGIRSGMELDHIIPVKSGGGGCWLSNYQLLCYDCHKAKTHSRY